MTLLAEQLGAQLVKVREARGLSRRQAAKGLGMAPTTLRDLEHGLDNPSAQRIDQLVKALGVEVRLELTIVPARRLVVILGHQLATFGAVKGRRVAVLTLGGGTAVVGTLEDVVARNSPDPERAGAVDALVLGNATGRHLIPWHAVDTVTPLPNATAHPATR